MTDWSKLKVVELKEECKSRDIPLTGLKLKQHYIDKLEEYEATSTLNGEIDGAGGLPASDPREHAPTKSNGAAVTVDDDQELKDQATSAAETKSLSQEKDPVKEKTILAPALSAPPTYQGALKDVDPTKKGMEAANDSLNTSEQTTVASSGAICADGTCTAIQSMNEPAISDREHEPEPKPAQALVSGATSDVSTSTSPKNPRTETVEDQRKRKRRSVSLSPTAEGIAKKKARASDGTPIVVEQESPELEQIKVAAESAEAAWKPDGLLHDEQLQKPTHSEHTEGDIVETDRKPTPIAKTVPVLVPRLHDRDSRAESRNPSEEKPVAPALHSATSSLYIRNFKRPLHIPTLRARITVLAKSPSNADDFDSIKTFYLDSIRTHAFITFNSIAEASRVRSAMHQTRFPDEAMREPLFVDFIPDDKVQEWIDRETGAGGFGKGGSGSKRFEVIYNEGPRGIEATLHDVDSTRDWLPLVQNRSIRAEATPMALAPTPKSLQPDRSVMVSGEERSSGIVRQTQAKRQGSSGGTGFKALDELFSSTMTKPKLYYKLVPPAVADARLDMMKDLHVGHADMGKSGDEGMKRYSFEICKGRDEWVDKGPEFGFGRKGQDRLAGIRGRGGGYGGFVGYHGSQRGGDSWRGR